MGEVQFYRYVCRAEADVVIKEKVIRSRSGVTYFSPDIYHDAQEARRKLALDWVPECRIGPIPSDEMPDFDAVRLRPVDFIDPNKPGGGVQGATSKEVRLFDIYDF